MAFKNIEEYFHNGKILMGTNMYKGTECTNSEILEDTLRYSDDTIIIGETGDGKTFSISTIGNKMNEEDKKNRKTPINIILAVPTKNLSGQTMKDYNIPSVTGTTKKAIHIEKNMCVCVYDSIDKVFEMTGWKKDKNTLVIIDEIHKLVKDNSYRGRTMRNLIKLKEKVRMLGLTATPEALQHLKMFDNVIKFTSTEAKEQYKECFLYEYKDSKANELMRVMATFKNKEEYKNHKFLIFNDNKSENRTLKRTMEKSETFKNLTIAEVNADDDKSPILQTVINEGLLKGADIYISTSIFEAGTNILNKDPFICIYMMESKDPNFSKLKQSKARLRVIGIHTSVTMRKELKKKDIQRLKEELKCDYEKIKDDLLEDIELYNTFIKLAKKRNKEIDINEVRRTIKGTEGIRRANIDYYNCILFDDISQEYILDELGFANEMTKQKEKEIYIDKALFIEELKRKLKISEIKELPKLKALKDIEEAYKENKEISKNIKDENIELALLEIKHMKENVFTDLLEFYPFASHSRLIPTTKEEKERIELLCKAPYKEVTEMAYRLNLLGIDMRDLIELDNLKLDEVEKILRLEENKIFNNENEIGKFEKSKTKLSRGAKLRKLLDNHIGKTIKKEIELQIYRIYNPQFSNNKLNIEQRNKVFNYISEFYNCKEKHNKQFYIGKLSK